MGGVLPRGLSLSLVLSGPVWLYAGRGLFFSFGLSYPWGMKTSSYTAMGTGNSAVQTYGKGNYSRAHILAARRYWEGLTIQDLAFFWRHYTVGKGSFMYGGIGADTSFWDYLVLSAEQSAFEKAYDL